MRKLSDTFLANLQTGFLSGLTSAVRNDMDLNLEIRDSAINIYYKGNSLLQLSESDAGRYKSQIDKKFTEGLIIPGEFTKENVAQFIQAIPIIKQNVIQHSKHSLETEYEQLIIRANNFETRNKSEYFIVDRQYAVETEQFDLMGILWNRNGRRSGQEVPVCLMEVKFALNPDIREVHLQVARYYERIRPRAAEIAEEMQTIFRQKAQLGLHPTHKAETLQTLRFARDIEQFQFIIVLVDYNPNSSLLNRHAIAELPFASQVKIFTTGFAMWQQNVLPISYTNPSESPP